MILYFCLTGATCLAVVVVVVVAVEEVVNVAVTGRAVGRKAVVVCGRAEPEK